MRSPRKTKETQSKHTNIVCGRHGSRLVRTTLIYLGYRAEHTVARPAADSFPRRAWRLLVLVRHQRFHCVYGRDAVSGEFRAHSERIAGVHAPMRV